MDGGTFERITFERITGANVRSAFSFMMNHATYPPNTTSGGSTAYPPRVPGAPFPPLAPVAPMLRDIVVRDVHIANVTGTAAASAELAAAPGSPPPAAAAAPALGTFVTLHNAPVVNLTLRNITLLPVAAHAGAGWRCAAATTAASAVRTKAQVFACNASVVNVTPPLAYPHGCVLFC